MQSKQNYHPVRAGRVFTSGWGAVAPLMLAGFAAFGLIQRHGQAVEAPRGCLSRQQAETKAGRYLARVTGDHDPASTVMSAVSQQGVLFRSNKAKSPLSAWYVTCQTGGSDSARYLVRLNAQTGQVYGLSLLDDGMDKAAESQLPLLSRREAEMRARQCLKGMGVPLRQLVPVRRTATVLPSTAPAWNFTYRRRVPGLGARTVMVCINRETALPENIWNPSAALTAL